MFARVQRKFDFNQPLSELHYYFMRYDLKSTRTSWFRRLRMESGSPTRIAKGGTNSCITRFIVVLLIVWNDFVIHQTTQLKNTKVASYMNHSKLQYWSMAPTHPDFSAWKLLLRLVSSCFHFSLKLVGVLDASSALFSLHHRIMFASKWGFLNAFNSSNGFLFLCEYFPEKSVDC